MPKEGKHWDEELGKWVDDDIWDPAIRIKTGVLRRKQIDEKIQSTGGFKIGKIKEAIKYGDASGASLKFNKGEKNEPSINEVFYKNYDSKRDRSKPYSSSSFEKNTEVIVRVTGNSSSSDGLKNHLHYISRNGEREMHSKDGEIFENYQQIKEAASSFGVNEAILSEAEMTALNKKPRREAIHIIMSMRGKEADLEKIRQAAHNTIEKNFPGQYFVSATHDDTNNNHVHICMRARDEILNKAINIDQEKLDKMRVDFAKNLNDLGIEATATIPERKKKVELDKERSDNLHFQVLSFGEANYNFDEKEQMSYYVTYKTRNGKEVTIWGEDLQRVVKENGIHVNDYCRFEIIGSEPTNNKVRIKDKKDPNIEYERTIFRKTWDVSIKGRAEKKIFAADRKEMKKRENELTVIYKNGSAEKYKKKKIQPEVQNTQEQAQRQSADKSNTKTTEKEKDQEVNRKD